MELITFSALFACIVGFIILIYRKNTRGINNYRFN